MNKKNGAGLGIGYVSIMIIFAVICLTIFAVLSFQSAYSNSALTEKSAKYLAEYYKADESSQEVLAQLDGIAFGAMDELDFKGAFMDGAKNIGGVRLSDAPDGVRADITVKINERQALVITAVFYSMPKGDRRFEITKRGVDITDSKTDGKPLGVWDGQF